jgi:hypothetical protein
MRARKDCTLFTATSDCRRTLRPSTACPQPATRIASAVTARNSVPGWCKPRRLRVVRAPCHRYLCRIDAPTTVDRQLYGRSEIINRAECQVVSLKVPMVGIVLAPATSARADCTRFRRRLRPGLSGIPILCTVRAKHWVSVLFGYPGRSIAWRDVRSRRQFATYRRRCLDRCCVPQLRNCSSTQRFSFPYLLGFDSLELTCFGDHPAKFCVRLFVHTWRNDSLKEFVLNSAILFVSNYFHSALPQKFVIQSPAGQAFAFG